VKRMRSAEHGVRSEGQGRPATGAFLLVLAMVASGCIHHYGDLPQGANDVKSEASADGLAPDISGDGGLDNRLPDLKMDATEAADSGPPEAVAEIGDHVAEVHDQESESVEQDAVEPDVSPSFGPPRLVPAVFVGESATGNWVLRPRPAPSVQATVSTGQGWQLAGRRIGGSR